MSQIPPIQVRSRPVNVIRDLPPPVVRTIEPIDVPVTQGVPAPVTRGLRAPVIDMTDPTIDYPVIDAPTEDEWREAVEAERQREEQQNVGSPDTRDLPQTPTINVGGMDVPLPEVAPLITAGATAVVTTTVALGASIIIGQIKSAADPLVKKMLQGKKKKVKVKQVKPVLHFVPNGDGSTDIIEYSGKGMKVLESRVEKLEQYLRDQVDLDAFWEYDNKIIIDEELSKGLTKDGVKRFKKYFQPPKAIAKKLGAKFSF